MEKKRVRDVQEYNTKNKKRNISSDQTTNISEVADVFKYTIPGSSLSRLFQTSNTLKNNLKKECESDFHPATIASTCKGYSFRSSDSDLTIKGNILCQLRKNVYFDQRLLVQFTVEEDDMETFSARVIEPLLTQDIYVFRF
jgi:hypothetical protein